MLEIQSTKETTIEVFAGDVATGNFDVSWNDNELFVHLLITTEGEGQRVYVSLRALDVACLDKLAEQIAEARAYLVDDDEEVAA